MKQYTFFWEDGTREVLFGTDVLSALTQAGYTAKSLPRLSFYLPDDNHDFQWDQENKRWSYNPDSK